MKYDCQAPIVPPLQYGEFDQEIEILYGTMVIEIINELYLFLSFAESFSQEKAHNMVDLMLDSCFKGMDYIMDSISKDQVAILVQQYDELVVMPLLKVVMGFLNLDQVASSVLPSHRATFNFNWVVWVNNFNIRNN
jgi:hypothetical protein